MRSLDIRTAGHVSTAEDHWSQTHARLALLSRQLVEAGERKIRRCPMHPTLRKAVARSTNRAILRAWS